MVELMISLVVVTIILAIAVPSYQNSVRKGRRSDAVNSLASIQQAQERSRSSFSTYCTEIASGPSATACGLGLGSLTSVGGHYALSIEGTPTGTAYVAAAAASGGQAADTGCAAMLVRMDRGTISYGSGAAVASVDWSDPNRCWAK